MSTVTCKTTRYGAGCGHPVNDHDGNAGRECCCCSWRHNDPEHVDQCVGCWILHFKRSHPEPIIAGDLAELMPEHLGRPFWEMAIERHLSEELAKYEPE